MNLISVRFLKTKYKKLPSFSNILAFLGIFIGVFSLLIVLSIMNGLSKNILKRVIGIKSEVHVNNTNGGLIFDYQNAVNALAQNNFKVSTVTTIDLVIQRGSHVSAVNANGIDFDKHNKVANVLNTIEKNKDNSLLDDDFFGIFIGYPSTKTLNEDGIILGSDLSYSLGGVTVGEYIQLSSAIGTTATPFGLMPKSKRLKVVGVYSSHMPIYDQSLVFISQKNAEFYNGNANACSYIAVSNSNPFEAEETSKNIQKILGNSFYTESWNKFDKNLFQAMKIEKNVMFFALILMILIAAFNMSGNFQKLVVEKQKDIGILKALGTKNKQIVGIFLKQGLIIGLSATFFAASSALVLLKLQLKYKFVRLEMPGLPFSEFPVNISFYDFFAVIALSGIISIVMSVYPAIKTLRIEAATILRN